MSDSIKDIYKMAGGDLSQKTTMKDYRLSKDLLPIISSIKMSREKLISLLKGTGVDLTGKDGPGEANIHVSDVLYRGLANMSANTIIFLLFNPNPTWDMTRAVSTSDSEKVALGFARKQNKGWSILFKIGNANKLGFHVGDLSLYNGENEYFLAGKLEVKAVKMKFAVQDLDLGRNVNIWVIESRGGEVTVRTSEETLKGKEASNLILKIMFAESSKDRKDNKVFDHNGKLWEYYPGQQILDVYSKIETEKAKETLDEMSSMGGNSGGAVQGYGAPLGSTKGNEAFNKKQEREQRLKGDKLAEMYSSQGLSGRNRQMAVSAEKMKRARVERDRQRGLKNVMEDDDNNK
jgi:hypothetical protein